MKWLRSPLLVPTLFFLWNYKLWTGVQTFAADTGDGIGAFKFFSILPKYWNWFEGGGQAYWTEMAIYRLQDPAMWPFLLFLKALPVNPLIQFNLYILLRLCLLGVGTFYLLRTLKCNVFAAQTGTLLAMFGSAIPVMFRSIGALDLVTAFVGLSLFGLKFFETGKKKFLLLFFLVVLHSAITYHVLYLLPLVILVTLIHYKIINKILTLFAHHKKEVLLGALAVSAAFGAEFLAVKDPTALPALRSMRYGTWVDAGGKVVDKEFGVGEAVLSEENLKAKAEDCGTRFSCRYYPTSLLKTFILKDSAWSLTGYVSLAGLALLLISLLYFKQKQILTLQVLAALCFILSLGSQTPVWGVTQKIIPALEYVRHTGFYFHLFVFILCIIIALTLNQLDVKLSKKMKPILFLLIFADLLAFQRLYVSAFLNFTKEGQAEKIATNLPNSFISRTLRIYNPYLIPRSSAATTYGTPSALESIFVQDEITDDHLKRGENPRYFGFITLFLQKPMAQMRVKLGDDLTSFKERVGVEPYGILTPHYERTRKMSLQIKGDRLKAIFSLEKDLAMYLAVPIETIDAIFLNGRHVPYTSSETGYGVLFSGEKGENILEIRPKEGRRNLIYCLYYGAWLTLAGLALAAAYSTTTSIQESFLPGGVNTAIL